MTPEYIEREKNTVCDRVSILTEHLQKIRHDIQEVDNHIIRIPYTIPKKGLDILQSIRYDLQKDEDEMLRRIDASSRRCKEFEYLITILKK